MKYCLFVISKFANPRLLITLILASIPYHSYGASLDPKSIEPGDLTIIFDRTETKAKASRLLTLQDLNFSDQDLTAILEHAKRTYKIKTEFDFDGGATYQRIHENNANDEAFLANKCLQDLKNWKVSAVRIAPFEYGLPGSKDILDGYFASKNIQGMNHVFQVRFVLTPVCESVEDGKKLLKVLDAGLHVIYNVLPDDESLRSTILSAQENFVADSLAGRNAQAKDSLQKYQDALVSVSYRSFYDSLLQQLAILAKSRKSIAASSNTLADLFKSAITSPLYFLSSYNSEGDVVDSPKEKDRASSSLKWNGVDRFVNEDYFAALQKFTFLAAKKKNLVRVALNVLEGGDSWTLMGLLAVPQFQEGVFMQEDESKAKAVFQSLFPQELKTFQAVVDSQKQLTIRSVSTSGYYSMLGISSLDDPKSQQRGVSIADLGLFGLTDFFGNATDDGVELQPTPLAGEKIPLSKLLSKVGMINATTTSCTTCHVQPVMKGSFSRAKGFTEDIDSAFSLEPQEKVRIMGFETTGAPTLRSLTVNETSADFKKLKAYLESKP